MRYDRIWNFVEFLGKVKEGSANFFVIGWVRHEGRYQIKGLGFNSLFRAS